MTTNNKLDAECQQTTKIEFPFNQTVENVEIVRPRLSDASIARWRERFSTQPPMWVRPKLRYSVSYTQSGKIITILADDSDSDDSDDSDDEVSTEVPMWVRPQLKYTVSHTPNGKIITILGDDSDDEHLH